MSRRPCPVRDKAGKLSVIPSGIADGTDMPAQLAETRIEADALSLDVKVGYNAERREFGVCYALRNIGAVPVAVFDRGDRAQVVSGRLIAGAVPPPVYESGADGDLTLLHIARPLPQPAPILPPTPIAARLDAGAELRGKFVAELFAAPPRRLRWCLGVADFDPSAFDQLQDLDGLSLWRASFALVDRQRRLCTPWFDLATGAFAA